MAHLHALKLTGTLAGSGWTDNGSADPGCSQSSVLSGTELTQSVDALVALEAEAHIDSSTTYDFRCSVLQYKLVKSGTCEFEAGFDNGGGDSVFFRITVAGNIEARKEVGGSGTLIATATYNGATHLYQRFRYLGTSLIFDTSADGLTWTNFGTNTIGFTPSAGTAYFLTYADNIQTGACVVDFTNVPFAPLVIATTGTGVGSALGRTGDGDLTLSFPTDYVPVVNDFVLINLYNDQGDASTPTGYAEITGSPWGSDTPKLQAFTDLLAGGETSPVTTISGSGANISHAAAVIIWWGVLGVGTIGTASVGTGTPMTAGGITTVANNSHVLGLCGRGDNEASSNQTFGASSTGVVEIFDSGTAEGNDSQVSAYGKFLAAIAASGDGSADTSITDPWVSVLMEVRAEAAAAAGSIPKFSDHYRKMMAA